MYILLMGCEVISCVIFARSSSKPAPTSSVKGMQLGRKTKASDMFEAIKSESNLDDSTTPAGAQQTAPRVPME
ncbi:MAG: hypothetical protein BJ554DRAFT_6219, partial [Olpidium bornovanus]